MMGVPRKYQLFVKIINSWQVLFYHKKEPQKILIFSSTPFAKMTPARKIAKRRVICHPPPPFSDLDKVVLNGASLASLLGYVFLCVLWTAIPESD